MAAPDDVIHTTCLNYTKFFSANDKEGWLGLFAEGATVEDPVGTPVHEGKEAIAAFWDQSREMVSEIELRMIKANVCAGEAAFFMEVRPTVGDQQMVLPAIDVMTFDDDGHITTMRAFFEFGDMKPAED